MAGQLKGIDAVTRQIAALTEIGERIRQSGDFGEIKKHKDVMEQLRLLARRLRAGNDVRNAAFREAMESRRALGRLLIQMKEEGKLDRGGDPTKDRCHDGNGTDNRCRDGNGSITLEDLEISGQESSRCQLLARIPDEPLLAAMELVEKNPDGEMLLKDFLGLGRWYAGRVSEEAEEDEEERLARERAEAEALAIKQGRDAFGAVLKGYFQMIQTIGEIGGYDRLTAGWPKDAVREFRNTLRLCREKFQEGEKELGRIEDVRD